METKYISIKEACDYSNKSLSSIRRLVAETKKKAPNRLKFEDLKSGSQKIFIDIEYLNEYFKLKPLDTDSEHVQSNTSNSSQVNDSNEQYLISILKEELEAKNKQIDMLLERQRETNIMIEGLNQRFMIEAKDVSEAGTNKKKKWWKFG